LGGLLNGNVEVLFAAAGAMAGYSLSGST
jgi:hypothetical protein